MTINRSNQSLTKPDVHHSAQAAPAGEIEALSLRTTDTTEQAPSRQDLLQQDKNLFESPKRGWLASKVLHQARRLNSSGDQVSLKFTAKAKAHFFEQRTEITALLSRTELPAQYRVSLESSQVKGVATPHGSPLQAFAGVGAGTKIEFSFTSPEALATALDKLANGDSFEAHSMAAEFQIKGAIDASFELGKEVGKDLSLNIAQLGAQAKHQHSVRYESKRDQPVEMKLITLTEFEVKGSVGPEVSGKKPNGDDQNYKGLRGDASGLYLFEHTRTVTIDSQGAPFTTLMKNPLSDHSGQRQADQVRYQKQSKSGLSVTDSAFSPAQAQGTRANGTSFELKVKPGRFSMFETMKKATQGTADVRTYFSQLGETKISNFNLTERCYGLGFSHGNGVVFASLSLQACHQDHQQKGPVALYMDKTCVLSH